MAGVPVSQMNVEPHWLIVARSLIGLREVPGKEDAPALQKLLVEARAWWSDDATPWCGLIPRISLMRTGYETPRHWYRARAWLDWGIPLELPQVGCVVVYSRKGGGHVGFVVGQTHDGRIMTLGGNQRDQVGIDPFDPSRLIGYRWPREAVALLSHGPLPIVHSTAQSSRRES